MFWFYPAMFSLIWPNLKEQFVKYWCIDLCIWRVTGNNTLSFKQSMRPSFKWAYIYIQLSRALTWIKDIKSGILLLFFVTFFQIFVTLTIFISETLWSDEKYCMPHGKLKNNVKYKLLRAILHQHWYCFYWQLHLAGFESIPVSSERLMVFIACLFSWNGIAFQWNQNKLSHHLKGSWTDLWRF